LQKRQLKSNSFTADILHVAQVCDASKVACCFNARLQNNNLVFVSIAIKKAAKYAAFFYTVKAFIAL
jgi:hypothetical protein